MSRIPLVSLFSGGGFLDMGFIQSGFDVVYSNEFNKKFAKIHDDGMKNWTSFYNFPFHEITSTESLLHISPHTIIDAAFGNNKPQLWGIIGGPPCQDFTMNGNGAGFDGERGKMTKLYFNRIRKMKPSFFVMENVVGLMLRKEQQKILFDIIKSYILDDYYVDIKTLNALEFGVPQYRQRVFIVGFLKSQFPSLKTSNQGAYPEISTFRFDWPVPKYPNAWKKYNWPNQNPFGETPTKPKDIPIELCVESCLVNLDNVANQNEYMQFSNNSSLREEIKEGDTKRRSFKRLHRFRYSPTTCFGNNEIFLHPYLNRRITVREALRIQGVDDNYVLEDGEKTAKFKVIGNGVPVPLAASVAKQVYSLCKLNSVTRDSPSFYQ